MQYDMHYYATYAMAAAAGIPGPDAEVIATAAQFVDDQNEKGWVKAKSGAGVLGIATAHHPLDAGIRSLWKDSEADDTRLVWVPFHFLPGAEGNTFAEKTLCVKNSKVVNAMLDYYLDIRTIEPHREHALHLMGVAAHVYADTFAHYGFCGMSDEINQIQPGSVQIDATHSTGIIAHIKAQADAFKAHFAEALQLGHGAVFTYPDRPYLKWSFKYANGVLSSRTNSDTFLEACEALYKRFIQFSQIYYSNPEAPVTTWEALKVPVTAVIIREGSADERVGYWLSAMQAGSLGRMPVCRNYNPDEWAKQMRDVQNSPDALNFSKSHPYKFFAAADYHRSYVLKRLLPKFGLLVA